MVSGDSFGILKCKSMAAQILLNLFLDDVFLGADHVTFHSCGVCARGVHQVGHPVAVHVGDVSKPLQLSHLYDFLHPGLVIAS